MWAKGQLPKQSSPLSVPGVQGLSHLSTSLCAQIYEHKSVKGIKIYGIIQRYHLGMKSKKGNSPAL